jgi:hypothetical protein
MRLYYGGYGHNPSPTGKQYAYWGGDNYKSGQNVVAPVTNWKSGKTYNTMFTIQNTYDPNSIPGKYQLEQLGGIQLKSLGGKDVMSLPGASQYATKSQWTRASHQQARARLAAVNIQTNNTQAIQRLSSY